MIYEVNISSSKTFDREVFFDWLSKHIFEMENINGFFPETEVLKVEGQVFSISVRYKLKTRKELEDYFNYHAERMRGDLPEKFKEHFEFSRRILLQGSNKLF